MRIVITVDPEIPVPPRHYGGIERIVEMLVLGLIKRGVEVSLFANRDSTVPCQRIGWKGRSSSSAFDTIRNAFQLASFLREQPTQDLVVHSFSRMGYLLPLVGQRIAKIQSYQRHVTPRSVRWGKRLFRGSLRLTACSRNCADTADIPRDEWNIIPNGVILERYEFTSNVPESAPMVFLGRLERIKGPQHAVAVARQTGRRLIIAGNLPETPEERSFIEAHVLSACDSKNIEYVGPVDDKQKNQLLRQALCLLFPIEWDEPFGIVMAEALACGTPIVAFPRGAVPEVVSHGMNGLLCRDTGEMAVAIDQVSRISRATCRQIAGERFSDDAIVEQYLALYHQALGREPSIVESKLRHLGS